MSIPLRIIAAPQGPYADAGTQPGDMWRWPPADRDGREAWAVMLPGNCAWYTTDHARGGGRWDTSGVPPDITVTPSIWVNMPSGWHGWITAGALVQA